MWCNVTGKNKAFLPHQNMGKTTHMRNVKDTVEIRINEMNENITI